MTEKEKAEAYNRAIKRAKKWYNAPNIDKIPIYGNRLIERIFPEINESEDSSDEDIIKTAILNYLKKMWGNYQLDVCGVHVEDAINWLEKQGEPNPYSGVSFKYNGHTWSMCARDNGVEILVDGEIKGRIFLDNEPQGKSALEAIKEEKVDNANKVEPKFKVGDWVVDNCGYVWKIEGILNQFYLLEGIEGGESRPTIDWVDNTFHLWTIEDAKDGDVLVHSSFMFDDFIFIYNNTSILQAYCYYSNERNRFIIEDRGHHCPWNMQEVTPVTKEQRDLLFQKMKEAGYKWIVETKTLEKLVQPKFKVGDMIRHKETNKDDVYEINKVYDDSYGIAGFTWMIYMKYQDQYELVPNKFNPKTFKPFDKVLVRDDETCIWKADFYSHKGENRTHPFKCVSLIYKCCIPYNEDTKHLVGTKEEAPEFYKYWEE